MVDDGRLTYDMAIKLNSTKRQTVVYKTPYHQRFINTNLPNNKYLTLQKSKEIINHMWHHPAAHDSTGLVTSLIRRCHFENKKKELWLI